nr:MAG TPA: hypothetical protein [Caudoviricetes sp.]
MNVNVDNKVLFLVLMTGLFYLLSIKIHLIICA